MPRSPHTSTPAGSIRRPRHQLLYLSCTSCPDCLLFFPDSLSLIHQRSSEVTFRYLCCRRDFLPPPLSVLSTLSLELDAATAAKELMARPSQSLPPVSAVGMALQLVWYQNGHEGLCGISADATHEESDGRRAQDRKDESWAVLSRWCFEANPTHYALR